VAILLLAAAVSACAERGRGPWEEASPYGPLTLEVRNNNYLDVVVYAVPDGMRRRLGTVTGTGHAVFEIPSEAVLHSTGFRLEADPVGSREAYVSEPIFASPGSVVVLEIGSVLSTSSWHLR
jgi:hypothetical protein